MHEVVLISLLVFDFLGVAHATVLSALVDEHCLMKGALHVAAGLGVRFACQWVQAEMDALKKTLKEF